MSARTPVTQIGMFRPKSRLRPKMMRKRARNIWAMAGGSMGYLCVPDMDNPGHHPVPSLPASVPGPLLGRGRADLERVPPDADPVQLPKHEVGLVAGHVH